MSRRLAGRRAWLWALFWILVLITAYSLLGYMMAASLAPTRAASVARSHGLFWALACLLSFSAAVATAYRLFRRPRGDDSSLR